MRSFDAGLVTALAAETAHAFWLLELDLTGTYYYTNADITLVISANTYIPLAFEISDIVHSSDFSVDRLTIDISAVDLTLSAILLGEDVANKNMIISYIMLDSDYQEIATETFFRGFITGWTLDENHARIDCGTEFMLWNKKTLRLPNESCPWVFKGTECTYAGAEGWCDQSVERCKALSNYDNYGGRRYILAIEDKQVYWSYKGQ